MGKLQSQGSETGSFIGRKGSRLICALKRWRAGIEPVEEEAAIGPVGEQAGVG